MLIFLLILLQVINCGDLDSYPLLQYLDLSFSHIEHIEDDALGRLEILEVLMLDHNQLTKIPLSLPVSLEHLFLQNNNIMDIQSQSFQGLSSLKTLDLSHNKLLYLPDVALPKLQTLNLQSAEIRGISQGIVHTLPRLNELFLEDNPIKCSDLLGIAEWASTCRLRSSKEDSQTNDQGELTEDEEKIELKRKFEKMHNFYDKFEGEHCKNSKQLEQMLAKPACAAVEDKFQLETKRSSVSALEQVKVENFNFNSMIAIPLPAKKAVKTLTESSNKTDDVVVTATTPQPITQETPPTATGMKIERNSALNNNNSKTFILTKTMPVTTNMTTAPDEATQTLGEFAFKDKPQQHSNNTKKTFARATTVEAASFTETPTATVSATAIVNADKPKAVKELQPEQAEELESATSAEGLRAANLQETLKQTVAERIIKKDIKGLTATETATIPTQVPPVTTVDMVVANATAINSEKPETATTMTTETIAATMPTLKMLVAATATSKSSINPFKENAEYEKEFKTKIGSTKEIKSFETSTITPALAPVSSTTTAATIAASSQTSFPNAMFDVSSSTTTNKLLSVYTTSSTILAESTLSKATTPTITQSQLGLMTTGGDDDSTLKSLSTGFATATTTIPNNNLSSNNDNNKGQYNGQDNLSGLDNNKTLVALHISMPHIPHIIQQSTENQTPAKDDTHPKQHQDIRQESKQEPHEMHKNATSQHQPLKTTLSDVKTVKCTQSNVIGKLTVMLFIIL